jgi:DNA polymerase-3 subunit alpha
MSKDSANNLFDLILKFAGYGFNKSHSTGYSIIAYQTAYLKTHFPVQYMAAVLAFESGAKKTEDWAPYIGDCGKTRFPDHTDETPHVGFQVGPPDINQSDERFSVVFDENEPKTNCNGHIRFGLGAVKGAGNAAVSAIVKERNEHGTFDSIYDFCSRMSGKLVNRGTIESLVKGGAFDSMHGVENRAAVVSCLDHAIGAGASAARDREIGQVGLFGGGDSNKSRAEIPQWKLPSVTPWTQQESLGYEKDVLGIHVSGHPLEQYEESLRHWCSNTTGSLKNKSDGSEATVGGILTSIRMTVVRNGRSAGKKMALVTLQDRNGSVDGVIFSDAYQRFAHLLQKDGGVIVVGTVDRSRGDLQLLINRVLCIQDASLHLARTLELTFVNGEGRGDTQSKMELASGLLKQAGASRVASGATPAEVVVHVHTGKHVATIRSQRRVVVEPKLLEQLGGVVGKNNIRVISKN